MTDRRKSSTGFRGAAESENLAISVELALTRESARADIARQADLFRARADGVQISDNPLAWINMSSLAASSLLLNNDIDPIPIMTCRDRNRIGLQSDLLGLRAMGVTSMLLTRGRRVGKKHALHASTVFDATGRELIAMASAMNDEESLNGAEPFFIGTGAKAFKAKEGFEAESLKARADAGAEFLQTQLCFNTGLLRQWMEQLVQAQITWRYSIMVSVTPLPSLETTQWIKQYMPDSKIPESLIQRLADADDAKAEGIAICAETMRELASIPGVSGIHLISTGDPELLAAAIDASGLRTA